MHWELPGTLGTYFDESSAANIKCWQAAAQGERTWRVADLVSADLASGGLAALTIIRRFANDALDSPSTFIRMLTRQNSVRADSTSHDRSVNWLLHLATTDQWVVDYMQARARPSPVVVSSRHKAGNRGSSVVRQLYYSRQGRRNQMEGSATVLAAVPAAATAAAAGAVATRTCRRCKQQFEPTNNGPQSCTFHSSNFTGGEISKVRCRSARATLTVAHHPLRQPIMVPTFAW